MNFQNRQEFQKLRKSRKCQHIKKSLNIQTLCKIAKNIGAKHMVTLLVCKQSLLENNSRKKRHRNKRHKNQSHKKAS